MRRLPALLGILLVVIALVVPVVPGAGPTGTAAGADGNDLPRVTTVDNLTNHLTIPDEDVQKSEHTGTSIDVGAAISMSSERLQREHETRTFERAFYRADSESKRTQLIRSELDNIEHQQQALVDHQQRRLGAYADGSITVDGFVRTRVLVDTEARELAKTLDMIDRVERSEPSFTMTSGQRTRLENVRGELRVLRGPVGERMGNTFTGATTSAPVYVMVSTQDYMLATTTQSEYIRETHLASARNPNAQDQFVASDTDPLRAANTRAEDLYPWLYDQQLPSVNTYGTSSIYQLTANHPSGQLATYIDGGTTDVFHESQRLQLSTVRATGTRSTVNNSVRVEVTRAYETGPIQISVTDNETGTPVPGTVSISDRRIGATGDDGTLWAVEPRGSYSVDVTTENAGNVTVAVLRN
jgi:hypothetical protein